MLIQIWLMDTINPELNRVPNRVIDYLAFKFNFEICFLC